MDDQSQIDLLTDDNLDQVAGGMDCAAGKALSATDDAAAKSARRWARRT
jgi:uncharacterized protein YjbJ (UPF0337 family)